jgi:carbon monoxide dehydrogenase subunit G
MATIYREFKVEVPVQSVWEAIRDIGAVHSRLAKGFVTNTIVHGNTRTVVFANGYELHEAIISIDDEHRRLAYSAVGGKASHHNAYFQVFEHGPQVSRVVWVTDLLPEEMKAPIEQMVNQGVEAIKKTFASR